MAAADPDDRRWRQEAFDELVCGFDSGWQLSRAGAKKLLQICTTVRRHGPEQWTITVPSCPSASPTNGLTVSSPAELVQSQYWEALDKHGKGKSYLPCYYTRQQLQQHQHAILSGSVARLSCLPDPARCDLHLAQLAHLHCPMRHVHQDIVHQDNARSSQAYHAEASRLLTVMLTQL